MKTTKNVLATYSAVSLLAGVYRHNYVTFDTTRHENVAEHSYSLTVLAGAIAHDINKESSMPLEIGKVIQFAAVHDLVEAFMEEGDISVYAPAKTLASKKALEEIALKKLAKTVEHSWIIETIEEYERQACPESRFVYALDKIVVHMNVILGDKHHASPSLNDYLKTEKIAREKIASSYPGIIGYFNELCRIVKNTPHFFS